MKEVTPNAAVEKLQKLTCIVQDYFASPHNVAGFGII
jgi:hypothetical protein